MIMQVLLLLLLILLPILLLTFWLLCRLKWLPVQLQVALVCFYCYCT